MIDEIHLLGADRGPILEVIVSRMRYIAAQVRSCFDFFFHLVSGFFLSCCVDFWESVPKACCRVVMARPYFRGAAGWGGEHGHSGFPVWRHCVQLLYTGTLSHPLRRLPATSVLWGCPPRWPTPRIWPTGSASLDRWVGRVRGEEGQGLKGGVCKWVGPAQQAAAAGLRAPALAWKRRHERSSAAAAAYLLRLLCLLRLQGLFNFKPSVRPVPLECHIQVRTAAAGGGGWWMVVEGGGGDV